MILSDCFRCKERMFIQRDVAAKVPAAAPAPAATADKSESDSEEDTNIITYFPESWMWSNYIARFRASLTSPTVTELLLTSLLPQLSFQDSCRLRIGLEPGMCRCCLPVHLTETSQDAQIICIPSCEPLLHSSETNRAGSRA